RVGPGHRGPDPGTGRVPRCARVARRVPGRRGRPTAWRPVQPGDRLMASLPSAQFRKTFSRLTEPVTVTSHGHLLGTWVPGVAADADNKRWAEMIFAAAIPVADPAQTDADSDVVAERDSLRL